MKKLLIFVLLSGLIGCAEEIRLPPQETSDMPPPQFSEESLQAEQEAQLQAAVTLVAEAVQGYRLLDSAKNYPENLNRLVERGMLTSLPDLPTGYYFTYDPETGEVGTRAGIREDIPAIDEEAENESSEPAGH